MPPEKELGTRHRKKESGARVERFGGNEKCEMRNEEMSNENGLL